MDYIPGCMRRQVPLDWKLKAEAFERLVEKYQSLDNHDGFYSRNWLEFTELLEAELKELKWVLLSEGESPDPS